MPPRRRLLSALTVLASAYYALWACAPAATMRPMTLDLDRPNEFGLAATYADPLATTPGCATELFSCSGGYNGTFWYQHRFSERFSLGGTLFGGQSSFLGGGVQARFHWFESDRFRVGTDLEGGFLWGAAGIPLSARIVDDLWVYTEPSVGLRLVQPARLPLGLAWGVSDAVWVQGEGAVGFDPTTPDTTFWSASLGASVRF